MLLTFFDMRARMHYLNARSTLAATACLAGRPGHQRERHDDDRRDLVRRQRLPGRAGGGADERGALLLLTNTDGLFTANPAPYPRAELVDVVRDFDELARGDRPRDVTARVGRDAVEGRRRRDGDRRRHPDVDRERRAPGDDRARSPASGRAPASTRRRPSRVELQALAQVREADPGPARRRPRRRGRAARARDEPAAGRHRRRPREFEAGDAVEVLTDGAIIGKGIVNFSAEELRRVMGKRSARGADRARRRRRGGRAPRLLRAQLRRVLDAARQRNGVAARSRTAKANGRSKTTVRAGFGAIGRPGWSCRSPPALGLGRSRRCG